ncbi:MAG TPA: copper oxidase, partial [Gammaproteobacteria bacterium]|nr:copper oxidase [Gammaproteobacteria bacterium]
MPLSRRAFIAGLSSGLALSGCTGLPRFTMEDGNGDYDYILTAEPTDIELIPGTSTPAWTFNQGFPPPVIRARQHQEIRILFRNRLAEPTTIHWHGIRILNAMDGVPYLTQPPIAPGADF